MRCRLSALRAAIFDGGSVNQTVEQQNGKHPDDIEKVLSAADEEILAIIGRLIKELAILRQHYTGLQSRNTELVLRVRELEAGR
jgi:hypothetical protein